MSLTKQEVEEFRDFAIALVEDGTASSLTECLQQWNQHRTHEQDIAAIREAQADVAAGRTRPAAEVEAEIRKEFGLRPRQPVP